MENVLFTIHVLSAIALVIVVLLQKSDGGALSGLGGGNPMSGMFSVRGTANLLTRVTSFLAVAFMGSGLLLASVTGKSDTASEVIKTIESTKIEQKKDEVPLAQ